MENRIAEFKLLRDCARPFDVHKMALPLTPLAAQPTVERTRRSGRKTASSGGNGDGAWHLPESGSDEWKRMQGISAALDAFNPTEEPVASTSEDDVDADAKMVATVLLTLSRQIAEAKDSMGYAAIEKHLSDADPGANFPARVKSLLPTVLTVIVAMLRARIVDFERLADATRLFGVGTLLLEILVDKKKPSGEEVRQALARKLFLPRKILRLFPVADVNLIRAAAVSDLYVVRSEWRGYAKGEIAALKNIMGGESLTQTNKDTHETERTQVTETTQATQDETSTETHTTSDLSREVSSLLSASLQAKVGGEVTGAFPGGTYRVGASAEGNIGIAVSEKMAAHTSQEAITKAISRVDTSVRSQRTTRDLIRLENQQEYQLTNPGPGNRRGVYRWLDRVERFMVFRIPDRLQLEFQLPNPAEFYKYRIATAAKASATGAPPEWKVTLKQPPQPGLDGFWDQEMVDALATKYRAADLPPMPKQYLSLTEAVALEAKNVPADDQNNKILSPVAAGAVEVLIPDGYEATEVKYFMSGNPVRAHWVREKSNDNPNNAGWDNTDPHVFHSIVLEAFVGGDSEYKTNRLAENQGIQDLFTTQGGGPWRSPNFGRAFARSSAVQSVSFIGPPGNAALDRPVRSKLKLGFKAVGAAHMDVGVQVVCRRTAERFASWRQQVFDILYTSWATWDRNFRGAQNTASMFGQSTSPEKGSDKNRETIQEELKRQAISWLLEEVPFEGRPALNPAKATTQAPWRQFDVERVIEDAPTIQFFEQAFDWQNMGWIFYPYYWSGKDDWASLADFEATDAEYGRFMRSGSARVLVPVRSSFEQAVQHWLIYKQPFLGRGLPLPSDPMFVSVASEIRRLTEAANDGEPVERAWDAKTATTYLWLEDTTTVPRNETVALGLTPSTEPAHQIVIE